MDARIRLWPSTAEQKSTAGYILEWLQKNPKRSIRTTTNNIARAMKLEGIPRTENSIRQEVQKMIRTQMLYRYGNKFRGTYVINYSHKDIPGYILDKAPKEELDRIKNFRANLGNNEHIDTVGCRVTEPASEECKEPTVETTITEPEVGDEKPEEGIKSSSNALEENTTSVPIKIEDTERGLSISITLNLNINK